MRLADAIIKYLHDKYGVKVVFTVTGGGAMYLNDAFGSFFGVQAIAMHHEQSVSMAAEGYARASNGLAVCQLTTGPGGTNAVSGCLGAWIDSEPILFISGQVETFSIAAGSTRQSGVQEVDIISMVKPFTKYSTSISNPHKALEIIDEAIHKALSPRRGPVWIDIPLDIQNASIDYVDSSFMAINKDRRNTDITKLKVSKLVKKIQKSKRPVILLGNGSRGVADLVIEFCKKYSIPIITSWNGKDLVSSNNPLLVGSAGQFGDRASNILINDADLIVGLGYRFSVPQVGYDPSTYAVNAEIVSVDVDEEEAKKCGYFIDNFIVSSIEEFMPILNLQMNNASNKTSINFAIWLNWAHYLKNRQFDTSTRDIENIDSFDFTAKLSAILPHNSRVVTDMGTSFTCTHQYLKLREGQRLITSSGLAAMGFGLPGAIGVYYQDPEKLTILITGDGGLMFNLQELQSVKTLDMNMKIIIYENQGYLTMKHMQMARFKRLVSSDPSTKIECPDFMKIASAFGIKSLEIFNHNEIDAALSWMFDGACVGPQILVVHLEPWQELTPRVQTRSDDAGKLFPSVLHQMYPYLTKGEEDELKLAKQKILNTI
jgi:acetolactate synthase-1/2/3 large subunit